jgi:hypothetical protein
LHSLGIVLSTLQLIPSLDIQDLADGLGKEAKSKFVFRVKTCYFCTLSGYNDLWLFWLYCADM